MRKTVIPPIALITDFGTRDWFVGSVKGQILRQHPDANIVDVTHQVIPGSVWHASYVLASCIRDFPPQTLFVVVVDPGVGTRRECIIGSVGECTVICPNNGILSHCLQFYSNRNGPFYEILPKHYRGDNISATFHGRDIFAPVAGKISAGSIDRDKIGPVVHDLVQLKIQKPEFRKGTIYGSIQYIDHFGNLITDISQSELNLLTIKPSACIEFHNTFIAMKSTFGDVEAGQPLTYVGSNGFLEIAVNRRNAAKQLNLKIGDPVSFHLEYKAKPKEQ